MPAATHLVGLLQGHCSFFKSGRYSNNISYEVLEAAEATAEDSGFKHKASFLHPKNLSGVHSTPLPQEYAIFRELRKYYYDGIRHTFIGTSSAAASSTERHTN